ETMAAAAADAAAIGSGISAVNAAAAAPTTAVAVAAADEGAAGGATLLSLYGRGYQALRAPVARVHEQIVQAVSAAGGAHTNAEVANANTLRAVGQDVLGAVNATGQTLLGRPLIGNDANGESGQAGQDPSSPLGGGIALVMGGSGLPTPYPRYAESAAML